MKTLFMKAPSLLVLAAVLVFSACRKDEKAQDSARALDASSSTVSACGLNLGPVDLPDIISGPRTLYKDSIYLLDGKTWVINGTLTIEPGTVIRGVKKTLAADASALIITRTAAISAPGTASCPIIFTSNEAAPAPGDWGGLVILGDAPILTSSGGTSAQIEGIDPPGVPSGIDFTYGGSTASDNSGILQYIRIEYAGAVIEEGNELNGLTLGGVGCGTTIDHIQVLRGADDGIEIFGGDVNAKYLFSYSNNDDQFDFDFGYKGNLEFLVSITNPSVVYAASNSNGFEIDGATTRPVLSNVTVVGANNCTVSTANQLLNGIRLRNSAFLQLRNSVIYGYPTGILLESPATIASFDNSDYCGTNTSKTYLFNNNIQACNVPFATNVTPFTFTPHSSTTSETIATLGLTNEFPVNPLFYFSTAALTPNAAAANTGVEYCGLSPLNCGYSFDVLTVKGGAVDAGGSNWIQAGYNGGSGWIKFQ